MAVLTYTKTGNKATTPAKLDKKVFGVEVANHDLLKRSYDAYLANGRLNLAVALKRGEVRGGGRKPWKQKGTGRARFGSSRVPIWRGGGITFGPTGNENYSKKMTTASKRLALRQALTLAVNDNKLKVIEGLESKDGKAKDVAKLLDKIEANRNVIVVVDNREELLDRATRNLPNVITTQATYLNVYDLLNADSIVMTSQALEAVTAWLGDK
jgi:large subunit ribosomal protein L4